ncbi:WPP domain-interacting protein 2-like [Henckelia pumila]|uniref:WPP domain-interacting protein 2-like n=1 Tax=Henckelia pumila TaxID=405737 RepID=UPI003C6E4A76
MDSVNECCVVECVEDNAGIMNFSAAENMEVTSPSDIRNNGSCVVESNDFETSEVVGKKTGGSGTLNLIPVEILPSLSPSSSMTKKGKGLRKWRRIKRDSNKVGDDSVHINNVVARDMSDSGPNPSKRMQPFSERKLKSQDSVSSMNATERSLDGFDLLGHSGTNVENGEIWSGKSLSTESSSPKIRSETSAVVEFPPHKIIERSFSGKNFTESTPQAQQGKSRIVGWKKSGGMKVNIEKENSHSSVESDVRSSNFVFMQGTYSASNGIQSESSIDYDGDNGNEARDSQQKVNNRLEVGEAGYKDYSPEQVNDDSSWEIKEGNQNNGSSTDPDPLEEPIFNLESVKEALRKELLKFREISQDVLVNDPALDLATDFANDDQNPRETSPEPSQSVEGVHRFFFASQSEVLETENGDVETEIEDLFVQKIKAEVEYLAISTAVQNLRLTLVDQITILEEQKTLASKQGQILNKLGDTEKKAIMLNKEAEKLEKFCEDIASADEALKLQNRVCKYTACFLMQLVLLAVVLGIVMFQLSPKYVDNIPT